ncbi:hypothetical protein KEM48_005482 [Puccinia striiformis f. sp. tritici PST-130]|nr:hypothetical protein KEM48_005482 [Puccinia striiformis f. sp. tritici PST-130]
MMGLEVWIHTMSSPENHQSEIPYQSSPEGAVVSVPVRLQPILKKETLLPCYYVHLLITLFSFLVNLVLYCYYIVSRVTIETGGLAQPDETPASPNVCEPASLT